MTSVREGVFLRVHSNNTWIWTYSGHTYVPQEENQAGFSHEKQVVFDLNVQLAVK